MEDVLIVTIIFGSALGAVKLILDFLQQRSPQKKSSSGADASITTSELKILVHEAVEEALDERFAQFEKRLEKYNEPRLIPAARKEAPQIEKPASPPVASERDAAR